MTTNIDTLLSDTLWTRVGVRATSLTLRPVSSRLPATCLGVHAGRAVLASSMAACGRPDSSVAVRSVRDGRVRGEWVGREGSGVVLYVHGSAFALASARTHRSITTRLAAASEGPVFAGDYRLAPRHCFPASAEDVRGAYDWLLGQGYRADQVVLAGDSAGGHLAVDLALDLAREGAATPGGLLLLSPLIDLTFALAEQQERQPRDPMISADAARRLVGLYTGGVDPAHPRLALDVRRAHALPPTLVQAGGAEMLLADAQHLTQALHDGGHEVELQVWPGQMHVFQALPRLSPQALPALDRAGAFVRRAVARGATA